MENQYQEVEDQVLDFNIERIRSIQKGQGQEENQKHNHRDQGGDLVIRVMTMTMTMMMMMMINDSRQKHPASHTSERTFVPRTAIFRKLGLLTPPHLFF